ncbi:MAG: hypothetical protein R3C15_00795 [Thermoleophilia bacterium]
MEVEAGEVDEAVRRPLVAGAAGVAGVPDVVVDVDAGAAAALDARRDVPVDADVAADRARGRDADRLVRRVVADRHVAPRRAAAVAEVDGEEAAAAAVKDVVLDQDVRG